jgi:tetratricopeptide (TPR) repeat protein
MKRLVLLAVLLLPAIARGELSFTPEEREVLLRVDSRELVKARGLAEKLIAANPRSFVGNWGMCRVHHDEEGNHARAIFYCRKAEAILVNDLGRDAEWHRKIILEQADILFEMNRNQEVLDTIDRYEELYGASLGEQRIWPLFKLGRPDEARTIALQMIRSEDEHERIQGYNGMLSIEFEAHDREASYKWSVDAVNATRGENCTILRNAAGSAFTRFRLREAEDYANRAHEARDRCTDAGYDQLAGLYIVEGEFQKALAAIEALKKEPVEKRYRPHYAMRRRAILADLLTALGKVDEAEKIAADLYVLPPRTGMISTPLAVERFSRSFRYWATLDTRIRLLAEKRSYGPFFAGLPTEELKLSLARWEIRRALIQLAAEPGMLVNRTRPNLGEISDVAPWQVGGFVHVLGTGVMRGSVLAGRVLDRAFPEAGAYLDALEGEIAYAEGRLAEADRLATAALTALPREEALLRWRTTAWQADALARLGRPNEARAGFQEVLRNFPSVLRILDLQVPAQVSSDGSALAKTVAERLMRSRRFTITKGAPFRLDVSAKGESVQICLSDESGAQFACAAGEKKDDREKTVTAALDAFHSAAFSPKVALTQSDLSSLDGSPVRVSADEVLKGVLGP